MARARNRRTNDERRNAAEEGGEGVISARTCAENPNSDSGENRLADVRQWRSDFSRVGNFTFERS